MRGGLVIVAGAGSLLLAAACATPYGDGTSPKPTDSAGKQITGATDSTEPAPMTPVPAAGGGSGGGGSNGTGAGQDGGTGKDADAAPADPANCPAKSVAIVSAWNAPPAASSVCSGADITYFAQVAANQTWLGIESLMNTRNAACGACIFSHDTDASWHAVIFSGTEGNALVNYAACFARASGGSDACGSAMYAWSDCYARVCSSAACGSDEAITACYNSQGASDACAAYSPVTVCGGSAMYASLNNVCSSYIDTARALCGAGN
jgi:hypothetical protein